MTKVIRFLNLVYMALATAAIVIFFTVPFIKLGADVVINKDEITTLIQNIPGASGMSTQDIFGEEDIKASINMDIAPSVLFKAYSENADKIVEEEFIDPNIHSIVKSLKEPINKVSEAILRITAKNTIKSEIEKHGITVNDDVEKKINEASDVILDSLKKEGATVDSVTTVLEEQVEAILNEAGKPIDIDTSEIKTQLTEKLNEYGALKEDGTIQNVDTITSAFLYDILTGKESPSPTPAIRRAADVDKKSVEEKAAEVEGLLAKQLKEKLPAEFAEISSNVFKGMLFALIAFLAVWAFLLIFTFIRTLLPKKCYTRVGIIFWLIGFVQIIAGLGLVIFSKFAFKLVSEAGESIGNTNLAGTMFKNINLTLTTSALVPGIFVLALIPFSIVYGVFRKKLKKQIRVDKAVDKKIAKMQIEK